MDTLQYIVERFGLDLNVKRYPIAIPNFGRDGLAALFCELGFQAGAEIGVEQGLYTEVLCRANPNAEIHAVDSWAKYPEYREHVTQEKIDQLHQNAIERLQPFPHCKLHKGYSVDVARQFEAGSLDFVYIDANHTLEHVIQDISEWSKRVRRGGIISGHDYRINKPDPYRNHTIPAVHAWTDAYQIRPWFVLGTKDIQEGEVRDRPRSWMWVKQ